MSEMVELVDTAKSGCGSGGWNSFSENANSNNGHSGGNHRLTRLVVYHLNNISDFNIDWIQVNHTLYIDCKASLLHSEHIPSHIIQLFLSFMWHNLYVCTLVLKNCLIFMKNFYTNFMMMKYYI